MASIYLITNKINDKKYVGLTTRSIEIRWKEHCRHSSQRIDEAIQEYGQDNFTIEKIEDCDDAQLDEREIYWIEYYNTFKGFGYNCNPGGGNNRGENNGRTKLTNEDVAYIRECYDSHMRRRDVFENFKDRISFSAFASIWDGTTWKDIKPEVYTEENKKYYMYEATNGQNSINAVLTDDEVMNCRERYVTESAKEIYKDYQNRISYQTLQQILWGRTYKHLPIYKKKSREWINK